MRRVRVLPFVLLVFAAATLARAQDTLAYTTTIVTVRAKPFANAQSLGRLDAGVSVRLYTCSAGWCSIAAGRRAGYVLQEYLGANPTAPPELPGKSYTNSRGERVPSPTRSDSPPAGASARCRDGTYSFSRSRSGTCSHHGGVVEWLH